MLAWDADGGLIVVIALDVLDRQVQAIRVIANPDKLRHLGPVSRTWHLRWRDRDEENEENRRCHAGEGRSVVEGVGAKDSTGKERNHASLRRGGDRSHRPVPDPQPGRGGPRGHRHHPLAVQGGPAGERRRDAGRRRRPGPPGRARRGPGRAAGRHRAPDDRAGQHAQLPPLRLRVRGHQRTAHQGHRLPAGSGPAGRHPPVHRAELHRLEQRQDRRHVKSETDPLDPDPSRGDPAGHGGDQAPGGDRARRGAGGAGAALRHLLRPRRLGLHARRGAEAADARHRRGRGHLVVLPRSPTPPPRPSRPSPAARPACTTSSTTTRPRCGSGCPTWPSASA